MDRKMEEIRLVEPSIGHQGAVEGLKKEFLDRGECFIHGSALLHQMEYPEWLRAQRDNGDPHTVREGRAVASTFLAMRARDERLVGLIDVRHSLDTDFFLRYGGHIGYAVRPSERRKGYGAAMLRRALAFASGIGLAEVMVSCGSDNLASRKTIEACGGRLAGWEPYADGLTLLIYWIAP